MIAHNLQRSATDFPARKTLARLGVRFVIESAISGWSRDGARCVSLLTGQESTIAADSLVLATGNRTDTGLLEALRARGLDVRAIGDAAAPRLAAAAIHDGRKTALAL